MELRTYAKIIWRYMWLVVLIVVVVAAYSGYQYYKLRMTPGALTAYSSDISVQIGLVATDAANTNPADEETVSQTLAETLVSGPILSSSSFCSALSQQIGKDMSKIQEQFGANPDLGSWTDLSAIASALTSIHTDSLVTVTVHWNTPAGAWALANAFGEVATAKIGQYLDYVVAANYTHTTPSGTAVQPQVSARVISAASLPGTIAGSAASKVTLLELLVIIALAMAIALAFLLDYLDDRLRTKEDVTDLFQLPVCGEVPHAPTPGHSPSGRNGSIA